MLNSRKNGILTIQRAQYKRWCNNRRLSLNSFQNTATIEDNSYKSNGRSFPLPPELLVEILTYLNTNQTSLHSASLVCKQWLYCVAPILYSHPQINDTYRWAMFILTLTRERMSFFYGDLIRSIDLSSGKSIEAMKDHEFYRRLSNTNDDQLQQQQPPQQPQRQNSRTTNEYFGVSTENAQPLPRIIINNMHADVAARISYHPQHQHQQQYELQQDILMKGLPFIIVSTSSLVQIAHTCKNITSLNLSYTSLLHDSLIAETGEYLSTLQRYAVQPGLTHIQIPIKQAIQAIGKECTQLQEVKIQRCEWVTAHVIWMFVYYCPNLKRLDARRSTKCTVKRLISTILEDPLSYLSNQQHTTSYPLPATATLHNSNSSSSSNLSGTVGADSSIVLPSSSSSSTVDVSSDFANLFNDAAGHNNNTIVFAEEEDDELDQQEVHENDNVTFHFRFNEETGLYEQLEAPNQSRVTLVRQLTEDMDENNNDGFWFAPFPPPTDEFGTRRLPTHTTMQRNAILNKSLKNIVYDIITDAKELGAIDLNWLTDYQH